MFSSVPVTVAPFRPARIPRDQPEKKAHSPIDLLPVADDVQVLKPGSTPSIDGAQGGNAAYFASLELGCRLFQDPLEFLVLFLGQDLEELPVL